MTTTAREIEEDAPLVLTPPASVAGEAFRYFAASLVALGIDAAVLAVGVGALGLAPWFAGAFGYAAGLVVVYFLSTHWVFRERAVTNARGEFIAFALLGLVGLLLNSVTLYVATSFGLSLPVAKALSAGVGFSANFITRKVLLFSRSRG
jgi:putative flippase GtrA